ncbi:hypothetical protein PSHT_06982 [Puccinia striiformis]|uniref:AMP-activated protein kinase glycogen-binding domain-containing protein n=1 Tax=Puccinia striiformis TaxID=27350 RepID=A0A2S4W1D9_9BASI|nr:hypothetical protein PSHT_06982 [Puccinia striiformis]
MILDKRIELRRFRWERRVCCEDSQVQARGGKQSTVTPPHFHHTHPSELMAGSPTRTDQASADGQQSNGKYLHHFRWESSVPERVSIKGSFDQWQSPLELQKLPTGKFSAPVELEFGSKVSYKVSPTSPPPDSVITTPQPATELDPCPLSEEKPQIGKPEKKSNRLFESLCYVIDGTWRHNPNEPIETDSSGNVNNIFHVPQHPSSVNPEVETAQTFPNPVPTMSSEALAQDSLSEGSTDVDLSKTAAPQGSTEPSTPPDMSIAFPSASTDNLTELKPQPKPVGNVKRTLSLFGSGSRFGRTSHRTQSLATAPGTPKEKASLAGASVSNVVSAMAGVAATAIPAAIFAVTGKDITRTAQSDSPQADQTPEGPPASDVPQDGDKLQTHGASLQVETPPKVSFSDDEATSRAPVAITANSGSIDQPVPHVTISPEPAISGATTPNKDPSIGGKSKTSETTKKSGWRHSVASIRSRRISGDLERRSVSDHPPVAKVPSPEHSSPPVDHDESSPPKDKRRSGFFQKIKSVLSPHKKNAYTTSNSPTSTKQNSLGRTATIPANDCSSLSHHAPLHLSQPLYLFFFPL